MPFEAIILTHLENILSEAFEFHNQLDTFLLRAGIESNILTQARANAETRRQQSSKGYAKAPKRYVVQETIALLHQRGNAGEHALSALITEVINPNFLTLTSSPTVKQSIEHITTQIAYDKKRRKAAESEKDSFRRNQEQERQARNEAKFKEAQSKRDNLKAQFLDLINITNPQQRGYAFEKFLSSHFELENLQPRGSFKIGGEQIDGSFIFQYNTHLLEAKWTQEPCAGAEFGAFMYKLQGKSADTRGLFVSINGYSKEAIESLKSKGSLHFICIDGTHLIRSLELGQTLPKFLETLWRHASETGNAYLPASAMN